MRLMHVLSWWSWEPWTVALLVLSGALYAIGIVRLWRSAGVGRGIARWQVASFGLATASLILALLSPIDAVSEILFSVHMVQHELLMLVAAPLLVFGRPLIAYSWALPAIARFFNRRIAVWRVISA